jgi:hypothetical protein
MQWKKSNNPAIDELTATFRGRSKSLSDIKNPIREDGTKGCLWCGDELKSKHHAARYCKDPDCIEAIIAWAHPQKEAGLFTLLVRQDWKCNICAHDYKPFIEERVVDRHYGTKSKNDLIQYNFYIVKSLKNLIEDSLLPEVDHVVPISKGGIALGLSNHQAICKTCHKVKSKVDNSGPRKKKIDK